MSVSRLARPDAGPRSVPLRSGTGAALITATVLASATTAVDANVIKVAVGLLVMLAASGLCAVASSAGLLITGRVVQGIGAALVVPTSLALLNGTLSPADRARGIGLWAGLETLGTTVGPYVGGWLVDVGSWRTVFLLDVPLILGSLVALRHVPESVRTSGAFSLDYRGALLAVGGLGGVIYALTLGPGSGWLSGPVLIAAVIGVVCLVLLVPAERRPGAPMLRLALFASRQFDAINVMTLVLYGTLSAASYLVILQCELRLGYSPAQAGAALIPESVVFLLLAPVSGALVARIGPRWLMTGGILFVAGGLGWLSAAQPGQGYAASIWPGVLLWGLGIGLAVTPLTAGAAAVITAVFVTDGRAGHRAGHQLVPRAPENGCPPPVPALTTTEES